MNGKGYANHKGVEFAVVMNSGKIAYSEKLTHKRQSKIHRFEDQKAKSALKKVFEESNKMRYDYTGDNLSETLQGNLDFLNEENKYFSSNTTD